ncbi:hypothetical protein H072_4491 [Dactylellina haptotyla CBS 200.50]|uniref:Uncharacterized protein n=1 Tax=Dactylellina haptotyla (strain CBS 200.50) TaxID=1284197 RepID=S8C1X3_DACHA|nr:hypothetical protein H072_4491 [Dactylellina haptotyla CBS 200.50]
MDNLEFRTFDDEKSKKKKEKKEKDETPDTASSASESELSEHSQRTNDTMPSEMEGSAPSYSEIAPPVELPPAAPPFIAPIISNIYPNVFPTLDHCIGHLKLLHAFSAMRDQIENTSGIFFATVPGVGEPLTDDLKLKDKRWSIFVSRAVYRFDKWFNTIPAQRGGVKWHRLALGYTFNNDMEVATLSGKYMPFDSTNLPPLDVLMVWHAYTLNPRCFFQDCLRYGRMDFWYTGLPWAAINECIDPYTFEYKLADSAVYKWEAKTRLPFNNLDTPNYKNECASCMVSWEAPWNTPEDTGFADKNFKLICPTLSCGKVHTMDTLSKDKFIKEMNEMVNSGYPLPGTLLDLHGLPKSISEHEKAWDNVTMPNRLIKEYVHTIRGLPQNSGMEGVKKHLEDLIQNSSLVTKASKTERLTQGKLLNIHKLAIRRMMSAYWDNPWSQSINPVGAVLRQGTFVSKMTNDLNWYHSPALRNTASRACVRYNRFISLMRSRAKKTLVPTLDIDLAWHTHQTMCHNYYTYTVQTTARFVDHDDKIDESKLSTAFEYTTKEYQKVYKEPYSECGCWYCQVVRQQTVGTVSRIFQRKPLEFDCGTDEPRNHLSTHGVVRIEDRVMEAQRKLLKANLDKAYKKLCEERAKKGKKPPKRPDHWGYYYGPYYPYAYYPYGVPYIPPFGMDPCIGSGVYGCNPGCMAVSAGAYGNCVSGACGAQVSSGGCGGGGCGACGGDKAACGSAGGGCGGNAGGGCGSGGDGGGGGGGGDGGGGGCGGGCGGCGG